MYFDVYVYVLKYMSVCVYIIFWYKCVHIKEY